GGFLIVWVSNLQDGSAHGVFARYFTTCGNGVVEASEQCDLGSSNCGATDTCDTCTRSCTSDCQLLGRCTGNAACCTTAADCPAGQGCCGNGITDGPGEQCDDGNRLSGDCCSDHCQNEAIPCVPFTCCVPGSEVAGSTVSAKKKVKLQRLG